MARYRKIDVRLWSDQKFRQLSPLPPCGQGLWLYLLTSPYTTNIPGLYRASEGALADDLHWPLKAFRKAFLEVLEMRMVTVDWAAPLIWVRNAHRYDRPASPNVVRSWRITWDEIPECPLKAQVYQSLKAFAEGLGEAFGEAFLEALPKGCPAVAMVARGHPSPNPDPEPDPDPEQSNNLVEPRLDLSSLEPVRNGNRQELVRRLFDFWAWWMERPEAKLVAERRQKIQTRLTEGYPPLRIVQAVIGLSNSPFHRGDNDRHKVYDDIELICRKGSKLENFIDLATEEEAREAVRKWLAERHDPAP